jgi:hypothetical protein
LGSKDEILRRVYPEPETEILRGVYPETKTEILRFAQDDSRRRAQDDKMGYLMVEFSFFGYPHCKHRGLTLK